MDILTLICRYILLLLCLFIAIAELKDNNEYVTTTAPEKTLVFTQDISSAVKTSLPLISNDLWSLCFWLKTWNERGISIVYRNKFLKVGCSESNQLYSEVGGKEGVPGIQLPVSGKSICSGHWHHICFIWNGQGKEVTLFENGFNVSVTDVSSIYFVEPIRLPSDGSIETIELTPLGTSSFNSPPFLLFSTQFTQLNIWNSLLDEIMVKSLAECSNGIFVGEVLSWSEEKFELIQIGITGSQICSGSDSECYTSFRGNDYFGSVNVTEKGYACQNWSQQLPNPHSLEYYDYQRIISELSGNSCRNPDFEPRPWCFTTNPDAVTEYCEVEQKKAYCASTYALYHDKLAWPEAQDSCVSKGGNLVHIDNEDTQSYLQSFIVSNQLDKDYESNYWFGLSNSKSDYWVYTDGMEPTFFNWEKNSRSSTSGTFCALLGKNEDYKWVKSNCSSKQGYICEFFPEKDAEQRINFSGSKKEFPMTSSGSVQISGGSSPFEGFLEVLDSRDDHWKYICDTSFSFIEATVVCNELGFAGAFPIHKPPLAQKEFGMSRFYGNNVQCIGKERSIKECQIDMFSIYSTNYSCMPAWINCHFPGYIGCFKSLKLGENLSNLTIQGCLKRCVGQIATLTDGNQCDCVEDVDKEDQVVDLLCTTPCSGDGTQICGGNFYSSTFNSTLIGSCGGTWSNIDSLTLYSPNYPGQYEDGMSCEWVVNGTATSTQALRLNFTMLSLGPGDSLQLYSQSNSPSTNSSQPIVDLNGSSVLPPSIIVKNTQVQLRFQSDRKENDQGFILTIEALKLLCNSSQLVTTNTETTLESNYYPGDPINVSCVAGYEMCGSPVLTCLDTGSWDQAAPICYSLDMKSRFFSNTTALAIGVTFFVTCLTVCFLFALLYTWLKRRQHLSEEQLGTRQTRDSKNNYSAVPVVQMSNVNDNPPSNVAAATAEGEGGGPKYEPVGEESTYVNVAPSHTQPAVSATKSNSYYEVPEQRKEPEPNYQPLLKNQRT